MGLGFLVVVVSGLLLFNFFNRGKITQTAQSDQPGVSQEQLAELGQGQAVFPVPTVYKVASGDTLWTIAEKHYKSGYNWVSIAKENNLTDPNLIEVGQSLKIPSTQTISVVSQAPVQGEVSSMSTDVPSTDRILGDSYTVAHNDDLWDIAVRAYGDGYAWVKIAQANKLTDPGMIHSGNVLKIPR